MPIDETQFLANWNKLDKNHDGKISFNELLKDIIDKAKASGALA